MKTFAAVIFMVAVAEMNCVHRDAARLTWDGTVQADGDWSFLNRIQAIGGPLCDVIVGLKEKNPSYLCQRRMTCDGYEPWIQSTNGVLDPAHNLSMSQRKKDPKIVVSIGHNGFGNQLFQHTFAQNVAQFHGAAMYVTSMDITSIGKRIPQNTVQGAQWATSIVDERLKWDLLPNDHFAKKTCSSKNATFHTRGVDFRSRYRNGTAIRHNLLAFLEPEGDISCLILVGYFQNKANPCLRNVRDTFKGLFPVLNDRTEHFPLPVTPSDIVIHLRCPKNAFPGYGALRCGRITSYFYLHYILLCTGVPYISAILNGTSWKHLYIIKPPGPCAGKSYQPVYKYIMSNYGPRVQHSSNSHSGFDEFLTMTRANKFVTDKHSTFSFWAAFLSIGSEVHVDVSSFGEAIHQDHKYIYHDEASGNYFGKRGPTGHIIFSNNV